MALFLFSAYNVDMKRKDRNLHLEKLKGGLERSEQEKIDVFFDALDHQIDMPLLGQNLLYRHFYDGFDHYLSKGYSVDEICKLIDVRYLGDFYRGDHRVSYSLDNAAIVYPLGMKYGQMPMFRLSVELKEKIDPELLQLALDFTIRRFPTFSAVIKSGFFWHYLETVNHVINVEEESDIPCKPISVLLRTYRSLRVLYYHKRISVEFFHTITDGTGGMVFLKTLLKEYLRLKGVTVGDDEMILDINEEADEKESVNEFRNARGDASLSTFVDKKSLQVKGKPSHLNLRRIVHYEMDADKLHSVAKSYNGTVTAYIIALEFLAAEKCVKRKDGIFNIQVPVNMRKFNKSKTLRNYSMYFNASMDLSALPEKRKLVEEISRQIREKGDENTMNQMMMTTGKIIKSLALVPLFIKVPIMQMVYGYLANSIIGCTLSNLGVVKVPEGMKEAIEKFYFFFAPVSPTRVSTSMVTVNDTTVFTVVRNGNDPCFEDELYELLNEDHLIGKIEGSVEYES